MLELTTTGDDRLLDLMKHLATTSVWEHYDGGMVCAISEIGQYFPKRISVELRYSANILVNKAAAKGRNLATPPSYSRQRLRCDSVISHRYWLNIFTDDGK
ncbi:hypothetical protein WAI453_004756 [Rhynchosporium graminicola]|uniref:Uncharacterized protein n=1 Tax=Rhynchosporium graminicola TaxID=2792576 RepID=A0A1E1LG88_9HELO|nr:uncharacterized protein RCO7_03677 [Rhynchosporium commune]